MESGTEGARASRGAKRRAVISLGLLTVLVVTIVSSAHGAPSTKKYQAYVVAANAASTSFRLTLTNDSTSQQTLGSANFTAPPNFTSLSVSSTPVTSTDGHSWNICIGDGMVCGAGNVVQFRAASNGDAIAPGQSVSATVSLTLPASPALCTSAAWLSAAKQSNDFSGTNNDFAFKAGDLTPLGSFSWASIGVQTTGTQFTPTVTAKDTCGATKGDYTGAFPYSGNTLTHVGLTGATFSGLTWSGGVGSVHITPNVAETQNSLTETDSLTTISATSNLFDVVDVLCTSNGNKCHAQDAPGNTLADSPVPPAGAALGFGFNHLYTFACGSIAPIGSFVIIDPSGYTSNYQVTLTYKKSISGSNPANNFVVCYSKDNGVSWVAAPNCATATGPTPCVLSRKRVSGGDLQVVLLLGPNDPPVGSGFG
jgi:hypothetical protein